MKAASLNIVINPTHTRDILNMDLSDQLGDLTPREAEIIGAFTDYLVKVSNEVLPETHSVEIKAAIGLHPTGEFKITSIVEPVAQAAPTSSETH